MKDKAAELLDSASLRCTQSRLLILEVMLKTNSPLTQDQIAKAIGAGAPNKTTIYRTLIQLLEKGLIHEAFLEYRSQPNQRPPGYEKSNTLFSPNS